MTMILLKEHLFLTELILCKNPIKKNSPWAFVEGNLMLTSAYVAYNDKLSLHHMYMSSKQ